MKNARLATLASTLLLSACTVAPVDDESARSSSEALSGIPYGIAEYAETGIAGGVDAITQPGLVSTPTELFWADGYGRLHWKHYDNKFRWQAAVPVPTSGIFVVGKPSAVVTDVNEWRVFVQGSDGSFWYLDYLGGNWLKPQMIGPPGTVKSGIGGVSATFDWWSEVWRVYFVGPSGHIYETSYTGGPWWSGGFDLGAVSTSAPSAVLRRSNGQINVFFRGTNGHLFDEWLDGASWHPAWDHGIPMSGDPAAIATPDDSRIDAYYTPFAVRLFGPAQLSSQTWTGATGWESGVTHGVVLSHFGAQQVDDVFGVDTSGHLAEAHPELL